MFKFTRFKSKGKTVTVHDTGSDESALTAPRMTLQTPPAHAETSSNTESASTLAEEGAPFTQSTNSNTDKPLAATQLMVDMIGEFANSAAPIPGIGIVATLIESVLNKIQTVKSNNADLQDLVRRICLLIYSIGGKADKLKMVPDSDTEVMKIFTKHLRTLEEICINLGESRGRLYALTQADKIKEDIDRIRKELDSAFQTSSILSSIDLQAFLATWKQENEKGLAKILIEIKFDADEKKSVQSPVVSSGVSYSDYAGSNSGTINFMKGGFNCNTFEGGPSVQQQASPINTTYSGHAGSNSGHIGVMLGGFNSNNHSPNIYNPNTYTNENHAYNNTTGSNNTHTYNGNGNGVSGIGHTIYGGKAEFSVKAGRRIILRS